MPDAELVIEGGLHGWRDFGLRCQQSTRNDQTTVILHITVAVNKGDPKWWSLRKCYIEPKSMARAFCEALDIGGGT